MIDIKYIIFFGKYKGNRKIDIKESLSLRFDIRIF